MKKYLLIILIIFFIPNAASAALLYSQAANQVVGLDHTFIVDWYLDTQDQIINSIDLQMNFTTKTLEVIDASVGSSGLDLWIQTPKFDNEKGTIELTAGSAGGFNTSKFPVFRTTFRGKDLGAAKITLNESSEVLLSDGAGTRMKLSFAQLNFPVVPADAIKHLISSPTHPDETVWYRQNRAVIQVQPEADVSYSYSFSSNTEIVPDTVADDVSRDLEFGDLPDGIYHFKLNSKTGDKAWEEAGVYRIQIDQSPPDLFVPVVASDPTVFDGKKFISFATTDKASGVSRYAVKVGVLGAWVETDSTYYVLPSFALSDEVHVKAIDSAGNEQISSTKIPDIGWDFRKILIWTIIISSLGAVMWFIRKAHRRLAIPRNPDEK